MKFIDKVSSWLSGEEEPPGRDATDESTGGTDEDADDDAAGDVESDGRGSEDDRSEPDEGDGEGLDPDRATEVRSTAADDAVSKLDDVKRGTDGTDDE